MATRRGTPDLHRRDLGQDQHDPSARPSPTRPTPRSRRSPHGHWQTTTLIAALGIEGVTLLDDRGRGGQRGCVRGVCRTGACVPQLKPGDVVIMDNLSSHKRVNAPVSWIEVCRCRIAIPAAHTAPDLNPIEMIFSKVKQSLRSLACRTRDALWTAMQSVLEQVTPTDARNCIRHCGYSLQLE